MTALFKKTDDIIRLGKWAYCEIPDGNRCGKCFILNKDGPDGFERTHWHCGLRPAMGLHHDNEGPFKDDSCPRKEVI